jgi:hypothetical protein
MGPYTEPYEPVRPPILTTIAIVSLIWSGVTVIRVVLWCVLSLVLGMSSWLLGPAIGAMGTLLSLGVVGLMLASSLLSILLFAAAWHTFLGDPAGRDLHKLWAWLNIALDIVVLVFTLGLSPTSWCGLVYACAVLYVMDLPEVRAYFSRRSFGPT